MPPYFKPLHLGITGAVFVGSLLIASLFVYRPWCHFCPFGLVGWLVEKASRVRISVDYNSCIACGKCAPACHSTVMSAILLRDKKNDTTDGFACYTCREACPANSITFRPAREPFRRRVILSQSHDPSTADSFLKRILCGFWIKKNCAIALILTEDIE